MKRLFHLILLVLAFSVVTSGQTKRVQFAKNSKKVVFNDSAPRGEKDVYTISLRKNQAIDVYVRWAGEDLTIPPNEQGISGFTIVYPNGKQLVDPQDTYIRAERAGEYKIIVSTPNRRTSYRYKITFTQQ